jgi:hypothetical protein
MSEGFVIEDHTKDGYLLTYLTEAWDVSAHVTDYAEALVEIFDACDSPVWFIVDFSASKWDVRDALFGVNFATRSGIQFLRHENMREFIAVGGSELVNVAVRGMKSPLFGRVPTHICKTLDEAFTFIESQV